MKLLFLWDIDGTLINSGGAGMRALTAALKTAFNLDGSLADIDFAGRTDRWIMRRIFSKFGLPATEENFARYFEAYIAVLPFALANPGARVLPGTATLLAAAGARGDIAQGLLTGNIRRGAEIKLGYHGLWRHFPFGAFADDSEQRNELGPHALRRAREHTGVEFAAARTWVIGDTPHDIECGRAIGARTLAAHQPTAVLADLADATAFWRIIGD